MIDRKSRIEQEAIGWIVRLRDAGAEEWEDFTLWLEADPEHAATYEEVALTDQTFEGLAPAPAVALPMRPGPAVQPRARRLFLGGAIAAAIAGVIGYANLGPNPGVYAVETGAGERRTITLADGSRIDLNGATRLVLDPERQRYAEIERGEALFTVVHDDARPFEVKAGDAKLVDLGTVFNVVRRYRSLNVGVADGAVRFDREGEKVELAAGMSLVSEPGRAAAVVRRDRHAIGGWREGRLSYVSAPVAEVAADLSRNIGKPVAAEGEVAARAFSGVIQLGREPEQDMERAAAVMGLSARRSGEGWMLAGAGETP